MDSSSTSTLLNEPPLARVAGVQSGLGALQCLILDWVCSQWRSGLTLGLSADETIRLRVGVEVSVWPLDSRAAVSDTVEVVLLKVATWKTR